MLDPNRSNCHPSLSCCPCFFPRSVPPQGLPDLEPLIMEHLFWPDPRKLTSLHPDEPEASGSRDKLANLLSTALQPMRDYLTCFKRCVLRFVRRLTVCG